MVYHLYLLSDEDAAVLIKGIVTERQKKTPTFANRNTIVKQIIHELDPLLCSHFHDVLLLQMEQTESNLIFLCH